MLAFLLQFGKNKFWYCSYACAKQGKTDGDWQTEDEYPETERCGNCGIHLNDRTRAEHIYSPIS